MWSQNCKVLGCKSVGSSVQKLCFQFPSELNHRQRWLEFTRRNVDLSHVTSQWGICADHFRTMDIGGTTDKPRIRAGAVPRIYEAKFNDWRDEYYVPPLPAAILKEEPLDPACMPGPVAPRGGPDRRARTAALVGSVSWDAVIDILTEECQAPWTYSENHETFRIFKMDDNFETDPFPTHILTVYKTTGEMKYVCHGDPLHPMGICRDSFSKNGELIRKAKEVRNFAKALIASRSRYIRQDVDYIRSASQILQFAANMNEGDLQRSTPLKFMALQSKMLMGKSKLDLEYPTELMKMAIVIRAHSTACFEYLKNTGYFLLPSEHYLRNYIIEREAKKRMELGEDPEMQARREEEDLQRAQNEIENPMVEQAMSAQKVAEVDPMKKALPDASVTIDVKWDPRGHLVVPEAATIQTAADVTQQQQQPQYQWATTSQIQSTVSTIDWQQFPSGPVVYQPAEPAVSTGWDGTYRTVQQTHDPNMAWNTGAPTFQDLLQPAAATVATTSATVRPMEQPMIQKPKRRKVEMAKGKLGTGKRRLGKGVKGPTSGNQKYKCEICDQGFSKRRAFIIHRRKHRTDQAKLEAKKFETTCLRCDIRFDTKEEVKAHKATHVTGLLKCPYCPRNFALETQMDYEEHILNHRTSDHLCVACGKVWYSAASLKHHMENLGPNHNNLCAYENCDAEFGDWIEHLNHLNRVHQGKFIYRCGKCEMRFEEWRKFKDHWLSSHPQPSNNIKKFHLKHASRNPRARPDRQQELNEQMEAFLKTQQVQEPQQMEVPLATPAPETDLLQNVNVTMTVLDPELPVPPKPKIVAVKSVPKNFVPVSTVPMMAAKTLVPVKELPKTLVPVKQLPPNLVPVRMTNLVPAPRPARPKVLKFLCAVCKHAFETKDECIGHMKIHSRQETLTAAKSFDFKV